MICFEVWYSPLRDDAGQVIGVIGVATDITERRKAEIELQGAHRHLSEAYDATIKGWSRALDLRDHETEGHTERVATFTLQLACAMGMPDDQLIHVQRGALLHDMGKMAIPDAILLKPGPLDEAEWAIMRKHPDYAVDMLTPIEYLRPALVIPHYHHEHWDGTGYPCGLKGRDIPLEARIFAVVDVWDALAYDRVYRKAWPRETLIPYIRSQSGKHFDPQVVDVFMRLFVDRE
jgi:HD-GYP domain-containing protein (c-di-GMP phosphodiesterase class II)